MKRETLARMIDHTLLKPDATADDIERLCFEALRYNFGAVCVAPCHVAAAADMLQAGPVKVATVIGFPLGTTTRETKEFEARQALAQGADELDMVIHIGAAREGRLDLVQAEIESLVAAAPGKIVKVIAETGYLSDEEITAVCQAAVAGGAHFVKTSTGFGPSGAQIEHVRLMRTAVGSALGVKAAGGIRNYDQAAALIGAGADRIGTSSGISILAEAPV